MCVNGKLESYFYDLLKVAHLGNITVATSKITFIVEGKILTQPL